MLPTVSEALAVVTACAILVSIALGARLSRARRNLAALTVDLEAARQEAGAARDTVLRADRTRAQFLGMVSHELRTPMMTLELQMERLSKSLQSPTAAPHDRQITARLGITVKRLSEVIESLLSYSAIQSGRMKVSEETFEPDPLIAAVVEELKPQAEQKGLTIRHVAADGDRLLTDPRLFRLVLVNLTLNAVKFTQRGEIEVNALWLDREFALTVRDTGPGIPEIERARIFEPFEQIEPLRNRNARGMGLGLAIVREIVATIGARLRLDSEVGVGSAFTVLFPRKQTHVG